MKGTNRSWRAQAGTKVRFATGGISGTAIVVRVLAEATFASGSPDGQYLIRDIVTGQEYTVTGAEFRLSVQ